MEKGKIYSESAELIRELKVGNESAFNSLFHSRYKDLCRFAWSFISNYAVAEDIVQELFSNIWHRKEVIDEHQSIDSYLYVSVRNACFTWLKTNKKNVGIDALSSNAIYPEIELFSERPDLRKLWEAIEILPLQCKVIFKLVVLEELKYKEVAEKLDISQNTVKTQMKIAYKTLRSSLDKRQLLLYLHVLKYLFD